MSTHQDDYTSNAPAIDAVAVTPSDSVQLPFVARALYVGGAGDVTLVTRHNQTVLFAAVPAGTLLPVNAVQVKSTGTGASNIVALA